MKAIPRILVLLIVWSALAHAAGPSPAAVQLVALMGDRLTVSREVAWTKYEKQLPVRDTKREKDLLATVAQKAEALGLPASEVQPFFEAQILASCALQEQMMSGWKSGSPLPKHPPEDLVGVIRPQLDRITGSMLDAVKALGPEFNSHELRSYAKETLVKEGYPEGVAAIAVSTLH